LNYADLAGVNLSETNWTKADLSEAYIGWIAFADCDLSVTKSGLESIRHYGPSHIATDTLVRCGWKLPETFLKGCGLSPWEVLTAKMYDPDLTPVQLADLQYEIFDLRSKGTLYIGGVFISYSWDDSKFVDKLHDHLTREGVNVWLDRHEMLAGDIQKQVHRAIRSNDVVVLVLSESSIESDWVENELDMARKKEKEEKRDVLCPVSLDDSWKTRVEMDSTNRALWLTLTDKLILDFSKWKTKAFSGQFGKLLKGMKINYEPKKTIIPGEGGTVAQG
jgi:hypothetical protein